MISEQYEDLSNFLQYLDKVNDQQLLPVFPTLERNAASFFYKAVRKHKPDLLNLALIAGITTKEFFLMEKQHSKDKKEGFDMYSIILNEILEEGFKKQSTEISFLGYMSSILKDLGNSELTCRSMLEDFRQLQKSVSERKDADVETVVPVETFRRTSCYPRMFRNFLDERQSQSEQNEQIEIGTRVEEREELPWPSQT